MTYITCHLHKLLSAPPPKVKGDYLSLKELTYGNFIAFTTSHATLKSQTCFPSCPAIDEIDSQQFRNFTLDKIHVSFYFRHHFVSNEVTQSFFSSACLLALEASWDYYLRHCDYFIIKVYQSLKSNFSLTKNLDSLITTWSS